MRKIICFENCEGSLSKEMRVAFSHISLFCKQQSFQKKKKKKKKKNKQTINRVKNRKKTKSEKPARYL